MAEIAAWRRAYSQMGLKPTKYRSAAEALLRRFKTRGASCRDSTRSSISVTPCPWRSQFRSRSSTSKRWISSWRCATPRGIETYLAWSGETESVPEGEVIFADAADHAHARRWTFRQSKKSTVRPETRRALVVAEGLHASADADVRELLDALDHELAGGSADKTNRRAVLTAASPTLSF